MTVSITFTCPRREFTSDGRGVLGPTISGLEFVEATYNTISTTMFGDSQRIAHFRDDEWELDWPAYEGETYSDYVISSEVPEPEPVLRTQVVTLAITYDPEQHSQPAKWDWQEVLDHPHPVGLLVAYDEPDDNWADPHDLVDDWRDEVTNGDTRLGFHAWAAHRRGGIG